MRGYGATVAGDGMEDAIVRTLHLNELSSTTHQAYLVGDPQPIPAEDLVEIARPLEETRARGTAGGNLGMLATYRCYRRLAAERS